jgi:hypothetical protein
VRGFGVLVLVSVLAPPFGAAAREATDGAASVPSREEFEDLAPVGELSGREIYQRLLENQVRSAVQHLRVISTDPGGSRQTTRFWLRWKDFRDAEGKAVDGVVSKALIKYSEPFDLRNTGQLIITNEDYSRDQWVYQPSSRSIRRVNSEHAGVGGSDLSFDDLGFGRVEDADYTRLDDEEIDGTPVYVVDAVVKPYVSSRFRKTRTYFEQEHYVPLRIRDWDRAGVEVRRMTADPDKLREFNGIWVPTEVLVVDVLEGTSSEILIEDLDPNVEIADSFFSKFRLTLSY